MTDGPWQFGWDDSGEVTVDYDHGYPADPRNHRDADDASIVIRMRPGMADEFSWVLCRAALAFTNLHGPRESCDTVYNMGDLWKLGRAIAVALSSYDGEAHPAPAIHSFPKSPAEILVKAGLIDDVCEFGKPQQETRPGDPVQGRDAGDEAE